MSLISRVMFFFFNDTATTEIYTLSLHDALPIYYGDVRKGEQRFRNSVHAELSSDNHPAITVGNDSVILTEQRRNRSEEHTSELQSHLNIVCRLLLEHKTACWRRHLAYPLYILVH